MKINKGQIRNIKALLKKNRSIASISRELGVSRSLVEKINKEQRQSYKDKYYNPYEIKKDAFFGGYNI